MDWCFLLRPRPNGSGHPHSHWGRSRFLKAERGIGRGSLERGQNWEGQKTRGFQGARKSCWSKVSPAIKQAHPQGPWRAPDGQSIHTPRAKNRNKPEHPKVHTETCSGDPYIATHRDVQTQRSSNTPSSHTHAQIRTHRQAYFTVPDRMSLPSALAH